MDLFKHYSKSARVKKHKCNDTICQFYNADNPTGQITQIFNKYDDTQKEYPISQ